MISPEGKEADLLLARLSSADWRARQEALEALEHWEGPSLARALLRLVRKDPSDLSALSGALDALERLGRSVHGSISEELIALLDDPDADMRMVAPLVLGELCDTAAVPALVRVAQREEEEENTRFNAIEALGKLNDSSAAPALRGIITSSPPYLRYAAVLALGQVGGADDAAHLLPLLQDDYLAEAAATALAQIGDERAAPEIVRWLERRAEAGICELPVGVRALAAIFHRADNDSQVRAGFLSAAPALRGCLLALVQASESSSSTDPLWADAALLTGWLAQEHPEDDPLRGALIGLLANPPARPAVEDAIAAEPRLAQAELAALLNASDPVLAQTAARLLGLARVESAVPGLIEALESDDEALAAQAAESLGRINAPGVIEPLLGAMSHPSIQVRRSAVGALAVTGSPLVTERVQAMLPDSDPAVRESALQLIALLDDHLAAEAILKATSDEEISVRRAAVELLPRVKDPRVPALLEQAVRSSDESLRSAAVRACTSMPYEQVRPIFVRAAQDDNPWVRMHAVRGLGLHPFPDLLPLYAERLRDPMVPVRVAVVEALARLPRDLAAHHLTAALDDDNEDVRQAARRVLDAPPHAPDGKG